VNGPSGGLKAPDIKRLKELEHEKSKPKRIYADMALEHAALKNDLVKNLFGLLSGGRWWPSWSVRGTFWFSGLCQAFGLSRATYYRPIVDWARQMRHCLRP